MTTPLDFAAIFSGRKSVLAGLEGYQDDAFAILAAAKAKIRDPGGREDYDMRMAAEQAWLALCSLVDSYGVKLGLGAGGHNHRAKIIREIEILNGRNPGKTATVLQNAFLAACAALHVNAFYEGEDDAVQAVPMHIETLAMTMATIDAFGKRALALKDAG